MNSASNANSGGKDTEVRTHDIPIADAMVEFMKVGWAPSPLDGVTAHPSIPYTKIRRDKVSKQFVGKRLIFPSGSLKVRSNDSDYQFRAHSAFSWFTGIVASDCVPNEVLNGLTSGSSITRNSTSVNFISAQHIHYCLKSQLLSRPAQTP